MKKIFIFTLVLFITIVLFELFLRYSPFSRGVSPVVYDKDIGMWHKKDFNGSLIKECYKSEYSFDKFGIIKNDYFYDKNKKDVILLGDSQVEALMVNNENIIHNSLYKELGGKYNVLNYGLSGTGPSQQYEILKHKVNLLNVDTIIHFVFLENDLNDGDPANFTSESRPKVYMRFNDLENYEIIKPKDYDIKERIRDFLGNFELYSYLKRSVYYFTHLSQNKEKKDENYISNSYELENEEYKWKQLLGSLYQIKLLTKDLNIKYKIVVFSTYEFNENYSTKREKLEKFFYTHDISNINIVPFIKTLSENQELSFKCDGHWNKNTHKALAKYILVELFNE